ncbi:MAG: hypothetical protein WAM27_11710 [Nitrososphaeraceae archaeon]|jgi:hypothetical protein
MEIVESITWISIGFIPMFVCLEVTWRKAGAKGLKVNKPRLEEEMAPIANGL